MMLEIVSVIEGLIFLLKQMEDFEALIDYPGHLQYLSKQDLMLAASMTVAFPKISKSSAKRRSCIIEQFLAIHKLCKEPYLSPLNMMVDYT